MHPALWISKTGLDAQQTDISVISHNLANVNTVGFKRGRAVFQDLMYQTIQQPGAQSSQNTQLPSGVMLGTGVRTAATQKIFTSTSTLQTENSLDLAINGRGFFQVLKPDGSTGYSRDGQFQLNSSGEVVNSMGYVLQPPVTIPQGTKTVTIGSDGTVSAMVPGATTSTVLATLSISDFINPAGLQPVGDNLYNETAASGSPISGTPGQNGLGSIMQGSLEASNVNVVEELVNMIETQRAYEMNSKAIKTVDSMLQFVSQTL